MSNPSKNLPLSVALAWIVGSLLLTSGLAFTSFKYYKHYQRKKNANPIHWINAIIQTGPQKEALKTDYLAELLDISADQPQSLIQFNLEEAKQKLLKSPVIKEAEVTAIFPSTLYINYIARTPIAWLFDYENIAIDAEGHFFPVYPFFTPKNLPEIYLGLNTEQPWIIPLEDRHLKLAFSILKLLQETQREEWLHIKRIDVSKAFKASYGVREIILICEDKIQDATHTRYLRLSTKNYPQELGNYFSLRKQLIEEERNQNSTLKVIDLRLPSLGYISTIE